MLYLGCYGIILTAPTDMTTIAKVRKPFPRSPVQPARACDVILNHKYKLGVTFILDKQILLILCNQHLWDCSVIIFSMFSVSKQVF